jgi:transcriptional regulator
MYQPPHFQDHDTANHHDLIRACPLGLLISAGGGGLMANPIPFVLDGQANVLRCHLARPNGQWKEFLEPQEVLVVFRGTDHYIHPGWYPSKRENGKVVPTWNYAMVQVHGQARVMDDPVWLGRQIRDLTVMMEGGMPQPWAVDEAPETFITAQMRGIVGVEIALAKPNPHPMSNHAREPLFELLRHAQHTLMTGASFVGSTRRLPRST